MPASINPIRVNHMNLVLDSVTASRSHFCDLYGAEFLLDLPQDQLHAYLFAMGDVIFEVFVPHPFPDGGQSGPHHLGVEYQADMDEVRAAVAERGIRIARDIGVALHTHPQDTFGASFEFYGDYFHDRTWDELGGKTMASAQYWRDSHPLGLTGLRAYTLAVRDIDAAAGFIQDFLSGQPAYEEPRKPASGRAIGLKVADAVVEVVMPDGAGALEDHLRRHGEGIRSTVFGVRDIEQARRYFAERGIETIAGTAPGAVAVPAAYNQGVLFEFAE